MINLLLLLLTNLPPPLWRVDLAACDWKQMQRDVLHYFASYIKNYSTKSKRIFRHESTKPALVGIFNLNTK